MDLNIRIVGPVAPPTVQLPASMGQAEMEQAEMARRRRRRRRR